MFRLFVLVSLFWFVRLFTAAGWVGVFVGVNCLLMLVLVVCCGLRGVDGFWLFWFGVCIY